MVVEDQAGMRKIIKTVLNSIGVKNVIEAVDGADALTILRERNQGRVQSRTDKSPGRKAIDLIVCDWAMPRMTGIQLLAQVRDLRAYRDIPFIMLTAEDSAEQVKDAIALGVTDYIVKPFTPNILESKLRSILNIAYKR